MKISLGIKIKDSSFGGGNQFARVLVDFLEKKGIEVVDNLKDKDIDIILLIDPRAQSLSRTFCPFDVLEYIRKINKNAIIVHRINECDERKGTKTVNRQLVRANLIADHTVYIGSWLISLFDKQGLRFSDFYSVIKNGADNQIFKFEKKKLPSKGRIKIVTHHWSPNIAKGWDVYVKLDQMLSRKDFRKKFEFHYIGNIPKNIKTENIIYHRCCNGKDLAEKLSDMHIYLTATINEPAGMHHIEGALCGLPLLYRSSGALPEYCRNFGVSFEGVRDFEDAFIYLVERYDKFSDKMSMYKNHSEQMCSEYLKLFKALCAQRSKIIERRDKGNLSLRVLFMFKISSFYYKIINILGIEKNRIVNCEKEILKRIII